MEYIPINKQDTPNDIRDSYNDNCIAQMCTPEELTYLIQSFEEEWDIPISDTESASKFIDSKLIDIMQFIISPMIIGSGINSLNLKPISNLDNALRPKNKIYRFGKEIIVSLNF